MMHVFMAVTACMVVMLLVDSVTYSSEKSKETSSSDTKMFLFRGIGVSAAYRIDGFSTP